MQAEQVIEKILSDARTEAEKIKTEANQAEAAEQAKLTKELERYRQQTDELAAKAGEDRRERILAAARMAIAKEYLAEKTKILNKVFAGAQERLKAMSDDEYSRLMAGLMTQAVETGDEEVLVDTNENRIDQKFLKQLNRELGPGFKANLRLAEQRQDIGGGFILRRGKIKNNVSLEVLLAQARDALEVELAKELFAEKSE